MQLNYSKTDGTRVGMLVQSKPGYGVAIVPVESKGFEQQFDYAPRARPELGGVAARAFVNGPDNATADPYVCWGYPSAGEAQRAIEKVPYGRKTAFTSDDGGTTVYLNRLEWDPKKEAFAEVDEEDPYIVPGSKFPWIPAHLRAQTTMFLYVGTILI